MKLEFSRQILGKYSNIKFHENPSSGSRVVPCGRTDGGTDMMKLVVAFHTFENKPKNVSGRKFRKGFHKTP
jgi:tRNA U38,U39,U40 pseudouridine synthase TruA